MFRALLAHLQEVLHKQQLVYCVSVTSVGCFGYVACVLRLLSATRVGVELQPWWQLTDLTRTQYTNCYLWSTS
jgi:hypothetical protein